MRFAIACALALILGGAVACIGRTQNADGTWRDTTVEEDARKGATFGGLLAGPEGAAFGALITAAIGAAVRKLEKSRMDKRLAAERSQVEALTRRLHDNGHAYVATERHRHPEPLTPSPAFPEAPR